MNLRRLAIVTLVGLAAVLPFLPGHALGQATGTQTLSNGDLTGEEDAIATPEKVDVRPTADDDEIAARLQRILEATGWFHGASVRVDEGVVFLQGTAVDAESKEWAANLSRRTQDVVAVVNHLELERPPLWNFEPATEGLRGLLHDAISLLPFIAFGCVILLISCLAAWLVAKIFRRSLTRQVDSPLLLDVLARSVGFLVLLLGVYIVLRVSGLTRLALTVVGGTGILGLVIGIAFRDITENFLASLILSMRRPYLMGDLVEIVGVLGYVQRLTTRATSLVTLEGNHVEIPNSTVYKNTIRNFTTNKNRRDTFTIGIGYDAPIPEAQRIVLDVLRDHPAVLAEPEPWALVDQLSSSAVVLKVYFWLDGNAHSWLKVRSSVIRMVKRAIQDHGIGIPDDAREIIFPRGVPIEIVRNKNRSLTKNEASPPGQGLIDSYSGEAEPIATNAEGGLTSDAEQIERQAEQARPTEADNLLH